MFDEDDEDDGGGDDDASGEDMPDDELYNRAVELVRRQNGASVSLLQRKMRIGYARAARLIDAMEDRGVVGPAKEGSSKQRDVLPPSLSSNKS
jgi:S-DNA-T family DNA segregation ATPase FtsK/SpoIIIE